MRFVRNAVYTRGQCTVRCLAGWHWLQVRGQQNRMCCKESAYFENLCLDTGLLPVAVFVGKLGRHSLLPTTLCDS